MDKKGKSNFLSASPVVFEAMTGGTSLEIAKKLLSTDEETKAGPKRNISQWTTDGKAYICEISKQDGYLSLEKISFDPRSVNDAQQDDDEKKEEELLLPELEEMLDINSLQVYGIKGGSCIYVSCANKSAHGGGFKMPPKRKLMVATRVHCKVANRIPDLTLLEKFLERSSEYATFSAIAVMSSGHLGGKLLKEVKKIAERYPNTIVLPIALWGCCVPALNGLLHAAVESGCELIQYQSLEVQVTPRVSRAMIEYMQESTLVVGAALPGDHIFKSGLQELNGLTSPWNTLAVWSVSKLSLTGFLMISDGVRNGIQGGVEEVAVIALMQALRPKSSMAKLLFLPAEMGLFWNKYFDTEERQDYHKKKMASKIERASGQLKALGLETGVVRHLEYKWDPKEEKEEGEEEGETKRGITMVIPRRMNSPKSRRI
mmetsp:Transcript_3707/g.5861  ORF Transcript_3707/g.5861 Transcript_3707/m.5861 type:complete len:430 (-) Transcript_3707:1936-3225(-)